MTPFKKLPNFSTSANKMEKIRSNRKRCLARPAHYRTSDLLYLVSFIKLRNLGRTRCLSRNLPEHSSSLACRNADTLNYFHPQNITVMEATSIIVRQVRRSSSDSIWGEYPCLDVTRQIPELWYRVFNLTFKGSVCGCNKGPGPRRFESQDTN